MSKIRRALKWQKAAVQVTYDGVCWGVALWLATLVRYNLVLDGVELDRLVILLPLAVAVQVGAGLLHGVYRGRWPVASFDEVWALARTTGLATSVLFVANFPTQLVPRSAPLGAGFICLVL